MHIHLQGRNLTRAYARNEGRNSARATWHFALLLFTLFACGIVVGVVGPRVVKLWLEVAQNV
jgi:hypothetical protein